MDCIGRVIDVDPGVLRVPRGARGNIGGTLELTIKVYPPKNLTEYQTSAPGRHISFKGRRYDFFEDPMPYLGSFQPRDDQPRDWSPTAPYHYTWRSTIRVGFHWHLNMTKLVKYILYESKIRESHGVYGHQKFMHK
ncbi:MAG: hypothetical protein M1818_003746 [Claussenomyces sp. TS43310]|nr:MAG: hypothetical protein M1818_003746 [Claussenomyces sp. TS43310]